MSPGSRHHRGEAGQARAPDRSSSLVSVRGHEPAGAEAAGAGAGAGHGALPGVTAYVTACVTA